MDRGGHVRHAWLAVVAAAAAGLAGCGGPTVIRFQAGERVNQVQKDKPENTPANLMIFLLKDNASFNNASPEQLWSKEKAKAVLGADLAGEPRETTVNAGDPESKIDLGALPADVRFVGVLARLPKQDPPVTRHIAVKKDEADDFPFLVVDYKLEVKK